MTVVIDTTANQSFSRKLPGLQVFVDSTSLSAFKRCPRYYQYTMVEGWEPKGDKVHLVFGIWYHGALERYDHKRAEGLGHDDALDFALDWVLRQTWIKELGRPWNSGDANKNRLTLIRTVVDYLDRFGENDSLKTIILADGKPAVELSFMFDSGIGSSTGEPFVFCGHLDRVAKLNDDTHPVDRKTTKYGLDQYYWAKFTPHNQFSLYTLATQVIYKIPAKSLIVDAAQILVGETRFERKFIPRSEDQLKEWHRDTSWNLKYMDFCAREEYWPQNDQACDMYRGCPFREVCSASPGTRGLYLNQGFRKQVWDPTKQRGDI